MKNFNLTDFVHTYITKRKRSMFYDDISSNNYKLKLAINNKSVLVIGGAGTIGSNFIKTLLKYCPYKLYVVDINENGLTELTRDLRSTYELKVPRKYKTYPMSFSDSVFYKMIDNEGPFDIIANFAAHKHVRSEKDEYSISALIKNNILNNEFLLRHLERNPPSHFFCVSSDKAANPANIMGASKKIMEEVIISYSSKFPITSARFANVAFSNGSLLDGFIFRILKHQPISAPKDVKRYFVSPKESGELCLLACILGNSGDIFFPKLDKSQMLTFSEISDYFLNSIGYKPILCSSEDEAKRKSLDLVNNNYYPVYYFNSNTSGEKSYEEFYTENEDIEMNNFRLYWCCKNFQ